MDTENKESESEKIDLIKMLLKLWKGKVLIILMSFFFGFTGVLFAFSLPKLYRASTSFILKTQMQNSGPNNLGGLASIAGINLDRQGSDEIPSSLYPMIIFSTPFLEALLKTKLPDETSQKSLRDHLMKFDPSNFSKIKKYTLGLPSLVKKFFFNPSDEILNRKPQEGSLKFITTQTQQLHLTLRSLLKVDFNKDYNSITLSFSDKNPEIAAIITLEALNQLQNQIIDFKIKNAKELLNFTETLFAKKKLEAETLQDELALFRDQNQNISSLLFENKLARLKAKFEITQSVNKELAIQVEQARIKINKDTPVFTIIEPVMIPNQKSSPKRSLITLYFTLFGFFFSSSYVLLKEHLILIKKQILSGIK
tara:strand:- start:941 stop:2041 length:1101 start_codon:yes stop_codon:yes gene_type:complete